jgi:hypothetical protein
MQDVLKRIRVSTKDLAQRPSFQKWFLQQKAPPKSVILINNSFVYRDKLQTTKSDFYPALLTDANGKLQTSDVLITSGHQINSDFKIIVPQAQASLVLQKLTPATARELKQLGHIVFLLIGETHDSVINSEAINHSLFKELILDPAATSPLSIASDKVTVKSIADEEALWILLEKLHGQPLPDALLQPFAAAVQKLKGKDHAILKVPPRNGVHKAALIDSWIVALKASIIEYGAALKSSKGVATNDPDAFTTLLRIAYNFAGDAVQLIRLLVSICDLKPLLRWSTSDEWFQLSEAFKKLPWSKLKGKSSLEVYQQMINGARNRAFHNLLLVQKTLEAEISGTALGSVKLRLFSEYSRRTEDKLKYQDKALVQILTEFTRAAEQGVSADFWTRNLDVMEATVALLVSVSAILKMLHKAHGPV